MCVLCICVYVCVSVCLCVYVCMFVCVCITVCDVHTPTVVKPELCATDRNSAVISHVLESAE